MRETVVVLVKLPDEPVTVTFAAPTAAVPLADRVRRLELVAGFTLNVAATPLGKPETVKFTLPLNPFSALIAIVVEPDAPWRMAKLPGEAERVKLG